MPTSTSYGRASWPLTTFFSVPAQGSLPVLPWFSAINATDPVTPPIPWAHWPTAEGFAPASVGFPPVPRGPVW